MTEKLCRSAERPPEVRLYVTVGVTEKVDWEVESSGTERSTLFVRIDRGVGVGGPGACVHRRHQSSLTRTNDGQFPLFGETQRSTTGDPKEYDPFQGRELVRQTP